jgi:hypothetical protein
VRCDTEPRRRVLRAGSSPMTVPAGWDTDGGRTRHSSNQRAISSGSKRSRCPHFRNGIRRSATSRRTWRGLTPRCTEMPSRSSSVGNRDSSGSMSGLCACVACFETTLARSRAAATQLHHRCARPSGPFTRRPLGLSRTLSDSTVPMSAQTCRFRTAQPAAPMARVGSTGGQPSQPQTCNTGSGVAPMSSTRT